MFIVCLQLLNAPLGAAMKCRPCLLEVESRLCTSNKQAKQTNTQTNNTQQTKKQTKHNKQAKQTNTQTNNTQQTKNKTNQTQKQTSNKQTNKQTNKKHAPAFHF